MGAALLALKGFDVTMEARAEAATSDAPAAATPAPADDPAADDAAPGTAGEVDVLSSLAKRRTQLDAREQSLDMRENLIKAAEGRVDGKIAQLKQLQDQVQQLLGQRDDAEKAQIAALVKTYSSMKPHDAAHIFNNLDDTVLLAVASQMKPDILGAILAGMNADAAQKLTVRLANKMKIPETPAPVPALAANTPPPTAAPQAAPAPAGTTSPSTTPQATAPAATAPAISTQAATPPPAAPVKK
jgi:flagellar motility protein MotE (MotC chaperone)